MIALIQAQDYQVDSLAIIRHGYLIVDAYFYPFSPGTSHIIHSCTKSIMSALIGIALEQGYIDSLNQPVFTFFPDKIIPDPVGEKATITLEHLLMMASGLDCRDSYLYEWRGLNQMRASDDWVQYVLNLPLVAEPGTRFEYCNGGSYTLSAILQQATGMTTLEFAMQNLFKPLGINEVEWPASPEGVNYGWGELHMKPLDMAKIGYLYLNEGQWGDQQIVPASWVQASTSPHIKAGTLSDEYGYQWWVDSVGYFLAIGYDGQFIFVLPEQDMVVVFTSAGDFPIPETLLNDYILPAVKSEGSLPPNADAFKQLQDILQSSATPP
jgi:CubicO group peptidase (beta-lactamase class C family)